MVAAHIPLEVWNHIFSFLSDSRDISSCSRIRKEFTPDCQRLIFKTVTVTNGTSSQPLLERLEQSQHLCSYITSIRIMLSNFVKPKTKWFPPANQSACARIIDLISPSLQQLTLKRYVCWGALIPSLCESITQAFVGPNMISVHLSLSFGPVTNRWVKDVPTVIENCPHLTHLDLDEYSRNPLPLIQFQRCPKLRHVELMFTTIQGLAPEYGESLPVEEQKAPLLSLFLLASDFPLPNIMFRAHWPFSWKHIRTLGLHVTSRLSQLQQVLWQCSETLETLNLFEIYDAGSRQITLSG
jgi:hypothetical protein